MSVSVDSHGSSRSPDLSAALTDFRSDAATSTVPAPYLQALRRGTPGERCTITVTGLPVTITLANSGPWPGPAREVASWTELRAAVMAAASTGVDYISPTLPTEVAAATWVRDGRRVRIRRPGAVRRARSILQRRLTILSPIPILSALYQPVAGSAAVVGLLITPALPDLPVPDAPLPAIQEQHGDVLDLGTPRPGGPHGPELVSATPTDEPGRDTSTPTPSPTTSTPTPSSPSPSPGAAPSASPNTSPAPPPRPTATDTTATATTEPTAPASPPSMPSATQQPPTETSSALRRKPHHRAQRGSKPRVHHHGHQRRPRR